MNDWLVTLNDFSSAWADGMVRACWQGGVAILFVWGLCRLLRRMPPAAKCWLWRLAYLKLFVALVWAAPIALPLLPAHAPRPELAGAGGAIRAEASSSLLPEDARHDSKTVSRQPVVTGLRAKSEHARPTVASWLLAAWLLAAGWHGIRVMRSWHGVRRLLASSRPARDRQLVAKLAQLSRELGLRRAPSLRTSDAVGSPSLLGVVRPAIVLPTSLVHACGPAELRLALAHELAHLRRRDLLWNWIPTLAEVLFFFHPALWLARRQWLFAQELACDEMAARVSRSTAVEMGRLLLQIASHGRCRSSTSLLTAEVSTSFSQIRRRLIAMRSPDSLHGRRKLLVAAMVCLLVGAGGLVPWRVTARESGGAEASSPADAAQDNTSSGSAARVADRPQLPVQRHQRVAVIDMHYLFQHDKAFTESLAEVKRQQRAAEAELGKKTAETRRLSGKLARLRPGTPDHGKLEEEIAARQAELQAELALSKKRLLRLEGGAYEATYDEVVDAVARFAEQHDVDAVYRKEASVDPPKARDGATTGRTTRAGEAYSTSVLRRLNRQVIYRRDEWDITREILEMLDRKRSEPEGEKGPDGPADLNR